jgi:hypothetical protein
MAPRARQVKAAPSWLDEPDAEAALQADPAEGAGHPQHQDGCQPGGPAAEPETDGQVGNAERQRHERGDGGHLERAGHRQQPERQPVQQHDRPGEAGPVEQELLVAEPEPGLPAVQLAVGNQFVNGELGADQMGHGVVARRRLRAPQPGGQPHGQQDRNQQP